MDKIRTVSLIDGNLCIIFESGSEKIFKAAKDTAVDTETDTDFKKDFFRVRNRALRIIGKRDHSTSELKKKLTQKGEDLVLIDAVIDDLVEFGYLNDKEFLEKFIDYQLKQNKRSKRKILNSLKSKGIDAEYSEENSAFISDEDERISAEFWAGKKYKTLLKRFDDPRKINEKLFAFLESKGFGYQAIVEAVKKVISNNLKEGKEENNE
ncbi:MAG: recombination regulator RecX [Ignavibacteriales bacterium]|nr:recombination regulator RecX [Ignavibacteriales bacterium]